MALLRTHFMNTGQIEIVVDRHKEIGRQEDRYSEANQMNRVLRSLSDTNHVLY